MPERSVDSPTWKKSSYSNQGNCVEVARELDGVLVRNTNSDEEKILAFPLNAWCAFIADLKSGDIDLKAERQLGPGSTDELRVGGAPEIEDAL